MSTRTLIGTRRAFVLCLSVVVMLLMLVSPALGLVVQIDNPDAGYLARTSKLPFPGGPDGSPFLSMTDGSQTLTFDRPVQEWFFGLPLYTGVWGNVGEVEQTTNLDFGWVNSASLSMQLEDPVYEFGFEASPEVSGVPYEITATFVISSNGEVIDSVARTITAQYTTEGKINARLFAIRSETPFDKIDVLMPGNSAGPVYAQFRYSETPPPLVAVSGTVKNDATGVGIPFATLHIEQGGGQTVADLEADYAGRYSVDLLPGDYLFHVRGPGWEQISEAVTVPEPAAAALAAGVDVAVAGLPPFAQDFMLADHYQQVVYRFFNMKQGVHFYSADDSEFINTFANLAGQFQYDGISYAVGVGQGPGEVPLYRFFNRIRGVHFYTASEAEKNRVISEWSDRYSFEGIAYFVGDDGEGLPVIRFYVPSRDTHFYTTDTSEITASSGLSKYYLYEGPAFWVGRKK